MSQAGRYGLVIASSEYEDAMLRRLGAPANDAQALAGALSDPAIGGFTVETLVNRPSYEVQLAVARFFKDRRRDDLLLLYFSGHGLKDDAGRLFLATPNTEPGLPDATSVPAAFVRDAMDRARSRRNVLVLDCCYSGAFAAGAKGDDALHTREGFAASGSVVLTASDAVEYSFEDAAPAGRPGSVFTRILVDGLVSGDADRDTDGDISLDELYDYVHDRMLSERPDQRPGKWAWDVHGRIVIARNSSWDLPARLREALTSPLTAYRLAAVEELGGLLRTGNADVVRLVRETLIRLADDDSRMVSRAAAALLSPAAEQPAAQPSAIRQPLATQPPDTAGPRGTIEQRAAAEEPAGAGRSPESGSGTGSVTASEPGTAGSTPERAAERKQQLALVRESLNKIEGTVYTSQRQRLLKDITGEGRMIAMLKCCHPADSLKHTVLLINTAYLIWARESFFSSVTSGLIRWDEVTEVVTHKVNAVHRLRITSSSGQLEVDSFSGKGVRLGDEQIAYDLDSVLALLRRLVRDAQST